MLLAMASRRFAALAISTLALAPACGAGDDTPVPGRELARLGARTAGLVADDTRAYVNDLELVDESLGHQVVRAIPRDGGPTTPLHVSEAMDSYPRAELALTAGHVVFVDRCLGSPPMPTCARLYRVPKAGGPAELLVEDRVYDVAVAGETIYYTTSDEHGLGEGAPDGVLYRLTPGAEPVPVISGLTHLRDLEVDAAAVYYVDTTTDGATVRLQRLGHGEVTPTTLAGADGEGSYRIFVHALDATDVYYGGWLGGLLRVAKTGGTPVQIATPPQGGIAHAAPQGDRVVWLDPGYTISEGDDGPSTYYEGAIMASPRDGGTPVELLPGQLEPLRVFADGDGVVWLNDGDGGRAATVRALDP